MSDLVVYSGESRKHGASPALGKLLRELGDLADTGDADIRLHELSYDPTGRSVTSPFVERLQCTIGNVSIIIVRPLDGRVPCSCEPGK